MYKCGHRGCRGVYPENTIPAFLHALEMRMDGIELDVVISKDKLVVISHDPYMNPLFCLSPTGTEVNNENLYQLEYSDIKKYDVGSKPHINYPNQINSKQYKPLLSELLDLISDSELMIDIEIKSEQPEYNISQPEPSEFVELVIDIINKSKIPYDRFILRSFDVNILKYVYLNHKQFRIAYNIENYLSADININVLGFNPDIYSPEYIHISKAMIDYCKANNISVVPWTVNNKRHVDILTEMGVDGIITDYPDILL